MTDGTEGIAFETLDEERRLYVGETHEAAAAACRVGLRDALERGYLPDRTEWSSDSRLVTVTYVYDPARAGRPV